MKKNIPTYLLILAIAVLIVFGISSNKTNEFEDEKLNAVRAEVLQIYFDNSNELNHKSKSNQYKYQEFQILITEGTHKNEEYWMRNTLETFDIYNIRLKEGDKILVAIDEDENGTVVNLHLFDRQRDFLIYALICLLFILILIIGRKQGFKAILTLVFTILLIIEVLLPCILKGYDAIIITIPLAFLITTVTLTVISGITKKTLVAILGITCGVVLAGVLSILVGNQIQITGLANEYSQQLIYLMNFPDINFQGVLFSSIIIGALGAVMDVGISIASSMNEIVTIQPKISQKELFQSGMNIGKDIMGSMSNTLILAYTGGSLELMLLFLAAGTPLKEIINLDMVASEIVRAVAGSIGLTLTIPCTVLIASLVFSKKQNSSPK